MSVVCRYFKINTDELSKYSVSVSTQTEVLVLVPGLIKIGIGPH